MSKPDVLCDAVRVQPGETIALPSRRRVPVEVVALASILLGTIGQLTLKAAMVATHGAQAHEGFLFRIADPLVGICAGLAIYGVGTMFWLKAVSRAAISYLYPLTASSYALVAIGGKFLFGENIQPTRWTGIAVIMLGVAMLAGSQQGVRNDAANSVRS